MAAQNMLEGSFSQRNDEWRMQRPWKKITYFINTQVSPKVIPLFISTEAKTDTKNKIMLFDIANSQLENTIF